MQGGDAGPVGLKAGTSPPKAVVSPTWKHGRPAGSLNTGSGAVDEAPVPCETPASLGQRVLRAPRGPFGARTASHPQLSIVTARGDAGWEGSVRGSTPHSPAATPGATRTRGNRFR